MPDCGVEVVVIANGCTDATADVARQKGAQMSVPATVIERQNGGKPGALNAGDAIARGTTRIYLDADVAIAPDMLIQLATILGADDAAYASGTLVIPDSPSAITRAFARFYRTVPFIRDGVPGCGLFAVNAAGRARWSTFPEVIADDTYVRLHFTAAERHKVPATYTWPLVDGLRNLIRVRRRQDAGVREINMLYPHLATNDDKLPYGAVPLVLTALRMPFSFMTYVGVRLIGRALRGTQSWSRGR